MKGMTLGKFLSEHANENVFIGAASGFVYIGPGKDFDTIHCDRIYIGKLRERLQKMTETVSSIQKWTAPTTWKESIPVFEADISDATAVDNYCSALRRAVENLKRLEQRIIEKANSVVKANAEIPVLQERLKTFVSFENRVVKESYPRIQNDGLVVIIEGLENGPLWAPQETADGYTILPGTADSEDE